MNKYVTKGVCSKAINFEINEGTVTSVEFVGGCAGNTLGIAKLTEGMKVADVIEKLKGVKCGSKGTSCPDQLATALEEYCACHNK
ncbi:TIGR03905 family TSCPD domain-containing protein [Clostridium oryzae]|uniref:ribonucleoside-diphosphate reductase n=1 Tax=Clostridium oryzae TaxID=1450648 RepID=A0A1V4IF77_9CLOT|nr:TIGR03905 family TSCPD domain-containing protein [Clostridium oryzae]OPJ58504.1 TSCPD domain protein [Clostridium oryzae]